MAERPDDAFLNTVGATRIAARQIDELIGLARGIAADGVISVEEAEFLQKWLVANNAINDQPLLRNLYEHVTSVLADRHVDEEECRDLLSTLKSISTPDLGLGEPLKSTTLPLTEPAPDLVFPGRTYCFTGTFMFGRRNACEAAVIQRGGFVGRLTMKTDVLVIGIYATESWKHSAFGNKILKAVEWREKGIEVAIVTEEHWVSWLNRTSAEPQSQKER